VTVDMTDLEDDVSKAEQVVEAIIEQKSQKQHEIDELASWGQRYHESSGGSYFAK
jgi:hypothetical protein